MTLHEKKPISLSWWAVTRGLVRGAISGKPLVEVAARSLSDANPDERTQLRLANQVSGHISAERAYDIIMGGTITSQEAIDALVEVVRKKGDTEHAFSLLMSKQLISEKSQNMMADLMLASVDSTDNRGLLGTSAFIVLMLDLTNSPSAQAALAQVVRNCSLSDRAAELLLCKYLLADSAQYHLVNALPPERTTWVRILLKGNVTCPDSLMHLLQAMPRLCRAIEPPSSH